MDPYRLSRDELESELRDHVGFLLSSAAAYDAGDRSEAKRLAVELRVLLSDSLLDKLGLLNDLSILDTCHPYAADNALPHYGLVVIRYTDVLSALDPKGRDRCFVAWRDWSEAVVLSDGRGGTLSRLQVIKTMADKRGAHVDLTLPPLYAGLSNAASAAYYTQDEFVLFTFGHTTDDGVNGGRHLLPEPVGPTIRQLAHEVLVSIALAHPNAFARDSDLKAIIAPRHSPVGIRGLYMSRESALEEEGPLTFGVHRSVRSVDGDTLG